MSNRRRNRRAPVKLDSTTLHAIEEAAERAAKRAVTRAARELKAMLLTLGFNTESPEEQIETQKDTAWTRRMRTALDIRASKVGYAVLAGIISIIAGLVIAGVNHFWSR